MKQSSGPFIAAIGAQSPVPVSLLSVVVSVASVELVVSPMLVESVVVSPLELELDSPMLVDESVVSPSSSLAVSATSSVMVMMQPVVSTTQPANKKDKRVEKARCMSTGCPLGQLASAPDT